MPRKTQRQHRQGEESRRAILEATIDLAAKRGYDGTSVALISQRTNLPASSIYWHFENKDTLLAEALESSYRTWRAATPTWKPRSEDGSPSERVTRRLRDAAEVLVTTPHFWSLGLMLTLQRRIREPAARRRYFEIREETESAVAKWWAQVLQDEALSDDLELPHRVARLHMVLMDGMFMRARAEGGTDGAELLSAFGEGLVAALAREEVLT